MQLLERNRSHLVATVITLICLLEGPTIARPVDMVPSLSQARSPYEMILCGQSASFELEMTQKTMTMIEVPGGHEGHAFHKDDGFDFKEEGNHKVYIAPTSKAPLGATTSMRFWLPNGREATIHARVVADLPVEDNVLLYHQSERQELGLMDKPNPCEPDDDSLRDLEIRARGRHSGEEHVRGIPEIGQVARSHAGIDVSIPLSEWGRYGHLAVDFEARNPAFHPSVLTDIRVLDEEGRPMEARLVYDSARDSGDESTADRLIATIDPRQTMKASILLPNAGKRDIEPMWFEFHGMVGTSKYVTSIKVIRMRPVTEEETAREVRAKQVALSVRGVYGAFWTGDAAGQDMIDGTTVAGVGVRFTKGISPLLAFEGEFVGGRTGDATFAGVSWDGMQGDVTRRASLGRLQAAGVIRFGDKYVTSTRLGVGVQLASYDSTMDAGGTLMEGPGDGLEVDGFFATGLGFDARLGKHWILGAGATFSKFFSTAARSLEAGLQLSYGWGGSIED